MNISAAEKKKMIVLLVIWLIVGVVGFVFFWTSSPVRELRAIISIDQATELNRDINVVADQVTDVLVGKPVGVAPEKIGDTPLSQAAKDNWENTITKAATQIEIAYRQMQDPQVDIEVVSAQYQESISSGTPRMSLSRDKGIVNVNSCDGVWYAQVKPTTKDGAEFTTDTYNCINLEIDSGTKNISKITVDRY